MAHYKWTTDMYRQLCVVQKDIATHEHEHSEVKRLQPLHAGLRKGLSTCFKAIESFVQPEFKQQRCLHCQGRFESVAAMMRDQPAQGIGWCDRCLLGTAASGLPDAPSSPSGTSLSEDDTESAKSETESETEDARKAAKTKKPNRKPSTPTPAQQKQPPSKPKRPRHHRRKDENHTHDTDASAPSLDATGSEKKTTAAVVKEKPKLSRRNNEQREHTPSPSPSASPSAAAPEQKSPELLDPMPVVSQESASLVPALQSSVAAPLATDGDVAPSPSAAWLDDSQAPKKKRRRAQASMGGGRRGKNKKKQRKIPRELKAYQTDKKTIVLAQIRAGAEKLVLRLPTVWVPESARIEFKQSQQDGDLLTQTMSFVPGQPSDPFATAAEACTMYVQQSAFGRKMDLRARYACGRCARPFNSYSPGGPNRIESAAARRQVAQRDVDFKHFCTQILRVATKVVRAEIYFSLLCDQCPPLLAALTQSGGDNSQYFLWSSFVDHAVDAYRIWQFLLARPRLAQQPSDFAADSYTGPEPDDDDDDQEEGDGWDNGTVPVLALEPPKLMRPIEPPTSMPDGLSQLVAAVAASSITGSGSGSQDASSSSNEQSLWDALVHAADVSPLVTEDVERTRSASGVETVPKAESRVTAAERCAICHYNLDMEHGVLVKDDEIPRTRFNAVARELQQKMPQVAYRRVQLDCGGAHEFCYVCAVSYYLQSGNKCPLCRNRFTHIADRPVADRDGSQALARRSRTPTAVLNDSIAS